MRKGQKMPQWLKDKMSSLRKGKPNPKISEALKVSVKAKIQQDRFRYNNPGKGKDQKGQNNNNWKGDNYTSIHAVIAQPHHFGKASHCENCGKLSDSSLRKNNIDWANITGVYDLDRINWKMLCRQCHVRYDRGLIEIR